MSAPQLPLLLTLEDFAREAAIGTTTARAWLKDHPQYRVTFGRAVRIQRRALFDLAGESEAARIEEASFVEARKSGQP